MKKNKGLRVIWIVVMLFLTVWELAGYYCVSKDVQKVVEDINAGKAVWSDYYALDLSEDLMDYMVVEESPSIVTEIMKDADIKLKVSPLFLIFAKVDFVISSIDYAEFVKSCEKDGVTEHSQMIEAFETYKAYGERTTYEAEIDWKWYVIKCEKNLQDTLFVDAATGGFVSYYNQVMGDAENSLESFLEGAENGTEN